MGKSRLFSRQSCVSRVCSIRVFLSKTDSRYSESRFTLRLTQWTDDRVSLYGSMLRLIKKIAYQSVIDAASHQKDLVKSKFLWTDDRVSLYGLTLRLIKKTAYQSEIDAASHQKDLVKSKFLWTDDRVSLYGSILRLRIKPVHILC